MVGKVPLLKIKYLILILKYLKIKYLILFIITVLKSN